MSKSLEELLVIGKQRPYCEMVPDRGRHKRLATVTVRATNNDKGFIHTVSLCERDEPIFRERAEKHGFTVETLRMWS